MDSLGLSAMFGILVLVPPEAWRRRSIYPFSGRSRREHPAHQPREADMPQKRANVKNECEEPPSAHDNLDRR
jgi:hypothetical protein